MPYPGLIDPTTQYLFILWLPGVSLGQREISRYELPALRESGSFRIPASESDQPQTQSDGPILPDYSFRFVPEETGDGGGRLIVTSNGVISAFDTHTRQQVGTPIDLAANAPNPQQANFYRKQAWLWSRPGNPGQVAVLGATLNVQIWDVLTGRLVTTIPTIVAVTTTPMEVAFDPSGNRLAVLDNDRNVTTWDATTARQVRAPIPAPTAKDLVGFASDGYLVLKSDGGSGTEALSFLDMATGALAGSIVPTSLVVSTISGDHVAQTYGYPGAGLPYEVQLTGQAWRDHLCAVANRSFAQAELALLPPGTDTAPPCS